MAEAIAIIPQDQVGNALVVYTHASDVSTTWSTLKSTGQITIDSVVYNNPREATYYSSAVFFANGEIRPQASTVGEGPINFSAAPDANGVVPTGATLITEDLGFPIDADDDYVLAAVTDNGSARTIYPYPTAANALFAVDEPIAAPSCTASTGGSLNAGAYILHQSFVDSNGDQSLASDPVTVTVEATGTITIAAVALPPGALGRNIFMSTAANGTTIRHKIRQDNGNAISITTAPTNYTIANPDVPRTLTATAGGTAADVKAIQVTVRGTNTNDEPFTHALPAFTVNATGIVYGGKAVKEIIYISIPAHDGTGATTAVGVDAAYGLSNLLTEDSTLRAFVDGVAKTVEVATDRTLEGTYALITSSGVNGSKRVRVDYYIPTQAA